MTDVRTQPSRRSVTSCPRPCEFGTEKRRFPQSGVFQLGVWILGIAIVWCVVLPYIASLERMRSYTRWLDQQGIDPSAMYYTELDAMKPILQRLEGHLSP